MATNNKRTAAPKEKLDATSKRRSPRKTVAATAKGRAPKGSAAAAKRSYHHGDLRQALLDAAGAILDSQGVEALTLRECARRAGVSHGAPAHHFGDVAGLLSAFTATSFEQLDAAMSASRAKAPDEAIDQLIAAGIAYVEYALANPARFRLMFRVEKLKPVACLVDAGAASKRHLDECIARIDSEGGGDGSLKPLRVALAWSMVHGFALLMLDDPSFSGPVGRTKRAVHDFLQRMLWLARDSYAATLVPTRARSRL